LIILVVLAAGAFSANLLGARGPSLQENVIKTSLAKAKVLCDKGRFQEALILLEQAVKTAVFKPEQDELRVALADTHISWAASLRRNYENVAAIEQYKAAFDIDKEIRRKSAASDLNDIGMAYTFLGENRKALESYEEALPIRRAIVDRAGEAETLNNIGRIYSFLGEKRKALDYYDQALPIRRAVHDRAGEATTLTDIGSVYSFLGEKRKALDYYDQALPIRRAVHDRAGEAATLRNIGLMYSEHGENQKALEYYEQALPICHAIRDRRGEARTLNDIGKAYYDLGEKRKALEYYEQALPIRRVAGDRPGEALTLTSMMTGLRALSEPDMAVFFGKQAVNLYQQLRDKIKDLDKELQRTYAKTVEYTYRNLADLLISRSRLPEAEQVLNLLKQEEYFNFVRRDANESSLDARATLTPAEAEWESRYEAIADKIAEAGLRHGNLSLKKTRTAAEEAELKRLDSDLDVASGAFHEFLDKLAKEFSATAPGRVVQIRDAEGLMEDLRELGKGSVAIYTLVGEEKTRIILITPDIQIARESQITRTDLALKVEKFRQALTDREDPRELGQELYRILIEPIAEDLKQASARILMWSLDGDLRYLPIAALYDGKGYFLERYCNVVFTPASNARLKDVPTAHWRGLGLGVSEGREGFKPLTCVPAELHGIFGEEHFSGGVIKGNVLLDKDFTVDAMKAALGKGIPLVHIASHFQLIPGNELDSFLLLGKGPNLTLAQVRDSRNLFGGVELLTLSACETAMGGEGEGTEVEGFAVTAQRQGAKAVIASLWSIADASTSLLMREFYRVREATPGMPKAEALRQAQLALLQGRIKPVVDKTASNPIDSYAHPYYWAPFILIGNWR
jgi:CHAT domain-containing protein/Tfp pilus assembly protein PilF